MAKILVFDNEAKMKLLEGISKLEKAVTVTLGPCGKNVIVDEFGQLHSTKDGVTVARSIELKDPFEAVGANALKEVASKSNDNCGDGTTTSTLLAAEIFRNGMKHVQLGVNATQLKDGIKLGAQIAIEHVKQHAKEVKTKDDIKRICTVSANGDKKIGELISDVLDKIGNDGTIKVEDSSSNVTTSSIVKGMVINQPYASPYFVNSSDSMEVDLDKPYVLVCNKKLTNFQELLPALQAVSSEKAPILIIADDFGEDVLATLVMNRLRGLNVCAVKSPSYGDNRKAILEDIAILCGGRVVSDETGTKLQNAAVETGILGLAKRVLVTKESTIFFDGNGSKEAVEARADSIRKQIEAAKDSYEEEELAERLARLTSGVGVISVGADTKAERKELRDRVDDAFCAAKAAIRSGYVPGAGTTLLHAKAEVLKSLDKAETPDMQLGMKIIAESFAAPAKKMLDNAGLNADRILCKVEAGSPDGAYDYGFNIVTQQACRLEEAGIIDPVEVVENEIKNASSIAGLLLTTECIIATDPESATAAQPVPQMM